MLANVWTDLLTGAAGAGEVIALNQFGTPQYAPGTYMQTNPDGTSIVYRQGNNASNVFSSTNTTASLFGGPPGTGGVTSLLSSPMLLIGLAVAGFFIFKGKR